MNMSDRFSILTLRRYFSISALKEWLLKDPLTQKDFKAKFIVVTERA